MFRIDNSTATSILPAPLPAATPGFFTSGNIGGDLATIVSADFMNSVQEELIAILSAAGITPDKTNNAQVIAAILALIAGNTRKRLTGPLDLYCAPGGLDTNNGLTEETPFATPAAAYNLLVQQYDLGGQTVTINLADGNYAPVSLIGAPLGALSPSNIVFQGNVGNPANVQINQSVTGGACFGLQYFGGCMLSGMELSAPGTTASCVVANFGSNVFVQDVIYGTAGYMHNWPSWGSTIGFTGSYKISGSAQAHICAANGGKLAGLGAGTVSLIGTPHFSLAFAYATNGGFIEYDSTSMTWSGAATGPRFYANKLGGIYVPGGTLTYFPGDTAGTADASTFGLYSN